MKKLLSGLIIILMISLLGHSFNAEAASYDKIIYDKAVNLKGVVNQSKRNDGIRTKMYNVSKDSKLLGFAKKYNKKTLIITREGKTARAKWYYCKLGNTNIGWIDARAFTNVGKPSIADTVPALWNSKKAIITTKPKSTSATTYLYQRNSAGNWYEVRHFGSHIGKWGFDPKFSEKSSGTPVGVYKTGIAFGQKGNPGTKLTFKAITNRSYWISNSNDKAYNTWQERASSSSADEKMKIPQYRYGMEIKYNSKRVKGKGSAVFYHVDSPKYNYTLGCVAQSEANTKAVLKFADKNTLIVLGEESRIKTFNTVN